MQQEGGGGHQSQYGEMSCIPTTTGAVSSSHMVSEASEQAVEAASPISSRPPATGNLDEFMRLASDGGDEGDRQGSGGGAAGVASGNRWPRQEALALLKIRSDMDATFRDATVKGPLWEDVSRKLAELGYKRSAKKCKEKFENVHKYYKRTKEGRAGRQDGKSYKFFSELEALHTTSATAPANVSVPLTVVTAATAASLDVAPVSVGIPMTISSVRNIPPTTAIPMSSSMLAMPGSAPAPVPGPAPAPPIATTAAPFGISFSSNSSSSSQGFDDDDDDEDELVGEPSNMAGTSRKRKRPKSSRGGGSTTRSVTEFFEGLMKQVMKKQEAMQQRFLEAIEKREHDRTIREEAWKRQEMARLTREHELIAQERAIAASRDAAIISFLQKITGQTIHLPTTVIIPAAPLPPTQPAVSVVPPEDPIPTAAPPLQQPPSSLPQQKQQQGYSQQQQQSHSSHHQHQQQSQVVQQQQHELQNTEVVRHHQQPISSEVVMAIPEQQVPPEEIGGSGSLEPASSRWPKAEVLALINLRSGLESRYQEVGPKGPLWEEISADMLRMGYKRSAKRCKEKWENINKYFKKVKESNKKRPEDAKTCPYFHQLDALHRKKIFGGGSSSGSTFSDQNRPEEETSRQHQDTNEDPPSTAAPQLTQPTHDQSENKTGATADVLTSREGLPCNLLGEGNGGAAKKPEDIVRKLMEEQGMHQQQQHHQGQSLLVDGYDKIDEPDSDNMGHEVDELDDEDEDDDDDDELEEEQKMSYKIEFQGQNASTPNGGGNGARSFFAMVQ